MTFDEWMNEVEVYSTRKERLIEGLVTYRDDHVFVIKWLEAAYNVGYREGSAMNMPIPSHPFDQTYPLFSKNCSRCGIDLSKAMGYVCNDSQCPTFTRVMCTTAVQLNEDK